MRFVERALTGAGICLAVAGCSSESAKPNVLLIAIDTLRADKLGCYGNARGLTPSIDALAAEGVRFEHAFSHAPWTLPAFATLFTSLYPEQHGAGGSVDQGFRVLREEFETLPERLREAGFATHAIVNVDFLSSKFGATQGFATIDAQFSENNREMRNAGATTDAALAWLAAHGDARFCLFVHYFDPHAEYAPPQPFRARFAAPEDRDGTDFEFGGRDQIVRHRRKQALLSEDEIRRAERLYDGEVAYTDSEIGRLLAGLAALGLDEQTLVVLTADHGEEFFDHGDYEHGHTLYDELIRVPLIVRQKGRLTARTLSEPVGHVDLAPTICALAGVERAAGFVGRDLSSALAGDANAPVLPIPSVPLVAFGNFWGAPLQSLRDASHKLIVTPLAPPSNGEPKRELYAWRVDPRETTDLAAAQRERTASLESDLELLTKAFAARLLGPRAVLSEAELGRLQRLGYIGGEPRDEDQDDPPADPDEADRQRPR